MTNQTKIDIQSILTHQKFTAYSKHNSVFDMPMWYICDKGGGFVESLSEISMWKIYERI